MESFIIQTLQLQILGLYNSALENYKSLEKSKDNQDQKLINQDFYLNKSICQMQLNDLEDSQFQLNKALSIENNHRIQSQQCQLQLKQLKFKEAKESIKKALELQEKEQQKNNEEVIKYKLLLQRCEVECPEYLEDKKQELQQKEKINYSWFQTDNNVGITLKYKIKDQKQVSVKVEEDQQNVEIIVKLDDDSESYLCLSLYSKVEKQVKIIADLQNVEIIFEKVNKSNNWQELQSSIEIPVNQDSVKIQQDSTFYPSSNKVKRDWNKIDKELEKELEKNPDEDAMNKLFKQIYANGNEETRRAMIKSFQTSGGTVLSTNWNEVQEKDYDSKDRPTAPDGQKWQKWEQ